MSAYMLTEEYRQYTRQYYDNGGRGYVKVAGAWKQPVNYSHYLQLCEQNEQYRKTRK